MNKKTISLWIKFIGATALTLLPALLLIGCAFGSKTATLGNNPSTKTTLYSFFSKSGLEKGVFDTNLSNTNFSSSTSLDGIKTDPETETIPATLGVIGGVVKGQSDVTVAAINALAQQQANAELQERLNRIDRGLADLEALARFIQEQGPTVRTNTSPANGSSP